MYVKDKLQQVLDTYSVGVIKEYTKASKLSFSDFEFLMINIITTHDKYFLLQIEVDEFREFLLHCKANKLLVESVLVDLLKSKDIKIIKTNPTKHGFVHRYDKYFLLLR